MLPTSPLTSSATGVQSVANGSGTTPSTDVSEESKKQFEKLLWAELLTHTGLEDSLTLGGGQGASMFARYFVEAIAADIAEQHPLGLLDAELPTKSIEAVETGEPGNG